MGGYFMAGMTISQLEFSLRSEILHPITRVGGEVSNHCNNSTAWFLYAKHFFQIRALAISAEMEPLVMLRIKNGSANVFLASLEEDVR